MPYHRPFANNDNYVLQFVSAVDWTDRFSLLKFSETQAHKSVVRIRAPVLQRGDKTIGSITCDLSIPVRHSDRQPFSHEALQLSGELLGFIVEESICTGVLMCMQSCTLMT